MKELVLIMTHEMIPIEESRFFDAAYESNAVRSNVRWGEWADLPSTSYRHHLDAISAIVLRKSPTDARCFLSIRFSTKHSIPIDKSGVLYANSGRVFWIDVVHYQPGQAVLKFGKEIIQDALLFEVEAAIGAWIYDNKEEKNKTLVSEKGRS